MQARRWPGPPGSPTGVCLYACVRAHCLYEFVGNAYRAALQVTRTAVGHKVQSVQAKLVQPCSVDLSATKADLRMLYAVLKGVRRSIVNRHKVRRSGRSCAQPTAVACARACVT